MVFRISEGMAVTMNRKIADDYTMFVVIFSREIHELEVILDKIIKGV